jgi:hypothetical protein
VTNVGSQIDSTPGKLPNKGGGTLRPAGEVEGRGLAKGNPAQQTQVPDSEPERLATCVGTDTVGNRWPARHYPRQESRQGVIVPHAWSIDSDCFRKICEGRLGNWQFYLDSNLILLYNVTV